MPAVFERMTFFTPGVSEKLFTLYLMIRRQRLQQEKQAREDAERQQKDLLERLKRFEEEAQLAQEGRLASCEHSLLGMYQSAAPLTRLNWREVQVFYVKFVGYILFLCMPLLACLNFPFHEWWAVLLICVSSPEEV